jgi:antitoxin component YwqK of YwqJK toxin-antitoxin module
MKNLLLILTITLICLSAKSQTEIKKDYYGNGKIKSLTSYINGKKDGIQTYYDKDGEVMLITPWVNDKKEGVEVYYKNGELKTEITYANGLKDGIYNIYYKGRLHQQMVFSYDKLTETLLDVAQIEKEQAIARNKERLTNLDRFFQGVEKMETKAIPTSYSTNDGNGVNGTDSRKVERMIINTDGTTTKTK